MARHIVPTATCGGLTVGESIVPGIENAILKIFAYANNHYQDHGPATVKLFAELWNEKK